MLDGRPTTTSRHSHDSGPTASWASSPRVRSQMQRQRTRDTDPEIAIRRLLHARGFRYWVDRAPLRGLRRRADLVFPGPRVAVFIDGCFWHGCPEHGQRPTKSNTEYWRNKIDRNAAKDLETDRLLSSADWLVIRVWEHEDAEKVADYVAHAVKHRRQHLNRSGKGRTRN